MSAVRCGGRRRLTVSCHITTWCRNKFIKRCRTPLLVCWTVCASAAHNHTWWTHLLFCAAVMFTSQRILNIVFLGPLPFKSMTQTADWWNQIFGFSKREIVHRKCSQKAFRNQSGLNKCLSKSTHPIQKRRELADDDEHRKPLETSKYSLTLSW